MRTAFLIKGDITGIQEFNFNVSSKGAAKALKARTFFIRTVELAAERMVLDAFAGAETIDRGGGNFYIKVKDKLDPEEFEGKLNQLRGKIYHDPLLKHNILSVILTAIPYDASEKFGTQLRAINAQSKFDKLNPYHGIKDSGSLFAPFEDATKLTTTADAFIALSDALIRGRYAHIEASNALSSVTNHSIVIFGRERIITRDKKTAGSEETLKQVLLWDNPLIEKYKKIINRFSNSKSEFKSPKPDTIVEFEYLSAFALARTGTDKLGILKMDVDNLGTLFEHLQSESQFRDLSSKIQTFFKAGLEYILNSGFSSIDRAIGKNQPRQLKHHCFEFKNGRKIDTIAYSKQYDVDTVTVPFKENIYSVYTGGDDCFFIGGWDAIIELAMQLQKQFTAASEEWKKDLALTSLQATQITLSASILIVDPHYPVVEFARVAEEELYKAKYHSRDASGILMKNSVSFLGHIFSWSDFNEIVRLKNTFREMIQVYDEPKAFLQRIIHSFESLDVIYWRERGKPFHPALLWRFYHHYRDIAKKDYFKCLKPTGSNESFFEYFFGKTGIYQQFIRSRFTEGSRISQELPVAARWAELLTRKNYYNNDD